MTRWAKVFGYGIMIVLLAVTAQAGMLVHDFEDFARIPVLDQGRVKPLDTFARSYLEGFYGREKLKEMSAIEWLAELLFQQERAYRRPVFNIPNPKLVDALELERRKKHKYSYEEVSGAISAHFKTWHSLFMKPQDELTPDQKQLLTLYQKAQAYRDISRSLSLLYPEFQVPAGPLAKELGVAPGTTLNYMEMRRKERWIQEAAQEISQRGSDPSKPPVTAQDIQLINIARQLSGFDRDKKSQWLQVVPPQWEKESGVWFSPWGLTISGHGSPQTVEYLQKWEALLAAYKTADNAGWVTASREIRELALRMAGDDVSLKRLGLEYRFNRFKPFTKSLVLYLMSFLVLLLGYLFLPQAMRRISFVLLCAGFVIHLGGVISRMVIMQRPPVTNLYASIIFVGLVCVLFGIILEARRKNGMGLLLASTVGTILQFLGQRYDADGDTMGMLQAVLDTNFWLATHVVCITIGYGCCLVAGVIGHMYLVQRIFKPLDIKGLSELMKNLRGVGIVALFFTALGTILGGIWADQSWGRFWGWDPKENGALLIVLWLIFLLHGRLAGKLDDLGFAAGMVCTNIVVALAWFGVNLLSVGLHSYGFTENAAFNLGLFCAVELFFALGCYLAIKFRKGTARG